MNKHFKDTRYYLKRAAEAAKQGIEEELEPLQKRVQDVVGEEEEDVSRVEKIREELGDVEERAEGEAKGAIASAREKLAAYRRS